MPTIISAANFATLMGVSGHTVSMWGASGKYKVKEDDNGKLFFELSDLQSVPEIAEMTNSKWEEEMKVKPLREYTSIELFAGAGGLALGMSMAGFKHVLLSEIDHDACATLMHNCPSWHVAEGDIHQLDFSKYKDKVDLLTGGFPCQAFSYAGLKGGFADTR